MKAYPSLPAQWHPKRNSAGHVRVHVLVAERALGRYLPAGAVVHHVDGDPHNNAPSNLVICENQEYHMLLHIRTRVLKAGGNPDTDRLCFCCRRVWPMSGFNRSTRNKNGGVQPICRQCDKAYRLTLPQISDRLEAAL